MRRREFITLVGSAVACPLAAHAQHAGPIRRVVAFINPSARTSGGPEAQSFARAFGKGLEELGWSDGRNIRIEYRWASGDNDRMQADVVNAVALSPDVIPSAGTQVTRALQEKTRAIPIVFVHVGDPLAAGLVQSLASPGGNITGFTINEVGIGGKWLEVLKEIAPRVNEMLVLVDHQNPTWSFHLPTIETAASLLKVRLTTTRVRSPTEIEQAIKAVAGKADIGMIVLPSLMFSAQRDFLISLAAEHKIPATYGNRGFVTHGGLMHYGSDWVDLYRRAASYVDQILKGAKPAELPVQQPTKIELVINLKTAKALGLTIPPTLLARADEVIE